MKWAIVVVAFAFFAHNVAALEDPGTALAGDLNAMNFSTIIGGPLVAAVRAQAAAARKTTDFINQVGLRGSGAVREVATVDFRYQSSNGTKVMSVPFLYLVPIPYIRIEKMTLNFNCKLTSIANRDTSTKIDFGGSVSVGATPSGGWGIADLGLKGSVQGQYTTETSAQVKREYNMVINVIAESAEMPGGMERVLQLFETITISGQPPITP